MQHKRGSTAGCSGKPDLEGQSGYFGTYKNSYAGVKVKVGII